MFGANSIYGHFDNVLVGAVCDRAITHKCFVPARYGKKRIAPPGQEGAMHPIRKT